MTLLLRCTGLNKSFPGVRALSKVDFDLRAGEVHALAGENGAGKSTLMHILAGVLQPDAGTIEIEGYGAVTIRGERDAQRLGISIVYQERSLFDLLSVADNLLVNCQPAGRFGVIDRKRAAARGRELLARIDLHCDPATILGALSPAEQQMVEIAKALSIESSVFILDEPTAALTFAETATLFRIIRQLRATGVGIIYISHRLEEIFEIADRVTVLKDGCLQGTWPVRETNAGQLVSRMVGRDVMARHSAPFRPNNTRTPALEVNGLSDERLRDITFTAFSGEILGFAGLAGAGRTELAMSLFGARQFDTGEVRIDGRPAVVRSPREAMAAGIGYLPEDRKDLGVFLGMSTAQNIAAAKLAAFGGWRISNRRVRSVASEFIARLRIAAPNAAKPVRELSGGNQQKVLLSRWLLRDPRILIVDEPTRGVDVGAKAEIHSILRELANAGKCVIVISSELPEVLAISDRILVMREGRIAAELRGGEATEETVMRYAAISAAPVAAQ